MQSSTAGLIAEYGGEAQGSRDDDVLVVQYISPLTIDFRTCVISGNQAPRFIMPNSSCGKGDSGAAFHAGLIASSVQRLSPWGEHAASSLFLMS